jgi:hypothetical protein
VQIGGDDFDGGGTFLTRQVQPDNSANNGAFAAGAFNVFGITDRTVNGDFADDSVSIMPADTFGILDETYTDRVFGVEDLQNPDNPGGAGTVTWTFDIGGATDLSIHVRVAAFGNFEAQDQFTFVASIDGGAPQMPWDCFALTARNHTYVMANGTNTNTVPDPLGIGDPGDPNTASVIDNCFLWLTAPIVGSGSTLTVTFAATQDSVQEVFVFDDLRICASVSPCAVPGGDADVNDDGVVNITDLGALLANFGAGPGATHGQGDSNNDGFVNITDLGNVLSLFGATGCGT